MRVEIKTVKVSKKTLDIINTISHLYHLGKDINPHSVAKATNFSWSFCKKEFEKFNIKE